MVRLEPDPTYVTGPHVRPFLALFAVAGRARVAAKTMHERAREVRRFVVSTTASRFYHSSCTTTLNAKNP